MNAEKIRETLADVLAKLDAVRRRRQARQRAPRPAPKAPPRRELSPVEREVMRTGVWFPPNAERHIITFGKD